MNKLAVVDGAIRHPATAETWQVCATLAEMDVELGRLTGTAEHAFLPIGDTLGHAVEVFSRLNGDLAGLAETLHGQDAESAVARLEQTIHGVSLMAGGEDRAGPLLLQLEAGAIEVAKRLDLLRRIIGEVVALAINGKIQAAQVTAAGVDFSVFTTDISRLGLMAGASTEQAAGRLSAVRTAVASAREAAADFERNEAKELDTVRSRIETSLAILADRRRRAALAADSVAGKSRQITERIANTVSELQINDSVCQRIEHIRKALRAVRSLAAAEAVTEPGCAWLGELPEIRRRLMIGGVCRLQADLLKGGAGDYRREVEGLARNLSALAAEAGGILAEAEAAFASGGGGSFVAEIEQDIRRASELLAAYASARDRTRSVVGAVSEGFRAMATDLAAIRDIDADMRIMGLNATLKCGRLGKDGLALGVVAHELRMCSRRTEECSHVIGEMLKNVLALSDALGALSAEDGDGGNGDPIEVMAGSLAILQALGESMSAALARLRADAGGVSSALTETAAAIGIHHRVEKAAGDGITRLVKMADTLAAKSELDDALHKDIHRLMQPSYTMDGERIIHADFAGDDVAAMTIQAKPSDNTDDFFF